MKHYRFPRALLKVACLATLLFGVFSLPSLALEKVHVVQRGETLVSIARRYDVSISLLASRNGIDNSDIIFTGQRVLVPGSVEPDPVSLGIHTVRVGDSLAGIAEEHGVSLEKLLFFNGMSSPSQLWVGQPILVPVAVGGPEEGLDGQHLVLRGETLYGIARRYDIDWQALAAHNGLGDNQPLLAGMTLDIPEAGAVIAEPRTEERYLAPIPVSSVVHTVTLGETLYSIARRYSVDLQDLKSINDLADASLLWVGQNLTLPALQDGADPVPQVVKTAQVVSSSRVPSVSVPEEPPSSFVHVVLPGETLTTIAERYRSSADLVQSFNQLSSRNLIHPGQRLYIPDKASGIDGFQGRRWVEIDLSEQTLTAWDNDDVYMQTRISSGTSQYPTPTGLFHIWHMNPVQTMSGPGYSLPNVRFNMYFFHDYAMHGTWWHDNFGQPMSHGCVNMTNEEAERLYHFVSLGTEVWVHQ